MAAITQKTKDSNTFRFKSFADRVSEIDVRGRALYHIGHRNEDEPEEGETYFHHTLKKWIVLNLTEEFAKFSRKCVKIVTLAQLIHQKDFVVDLLLDHLSTASNLSLQPLLELLYVLAKDLREEFYPYFQRVLDRLIGLLSTQDAEQLEWTFVCLAYLFKVLKPYLKKNIGVVFHAILPLLDEQRYDEHIVNFAVECFSFIARDVRDYRRFMDFMLETVSCEQVDSIQGCGRLLFEIMRGVKGLFHSSAGEFLHFIFESLVQENPTAEPKSQLLFEFVQTAIKYLLQYVHVQHIGLLWSKLCEVAQAAPSTSRFSNLIKIFLLASEYREGRYLTQLDTVVTTIITMLDNCSQDIEALVLLGQLVAAILLSTHSQITQLTTSRLLHRMLAVPHRHIYEQFVLLVVNHVQFEVLVLPEVVKYFESHFDAQAIQLMAQIVLKKQPLATNAIEMAAWQPYAIESRSKEAAQRLNERVLSVSLEEGDTLEEHLIILMLVPHLKALNRAAVGEHLQAQMDVLIATLTTKQADKADAQKYIFTLALLLQSLINLQCCLPSAKVRAAVDALLPHSNHLSALNCIDQLLVLDPVQFQGEERLLHALRSLLSSPSQAMRLTAGHCLYTLHREQEKSTPYRIFYEAESIRPDIHNYRQQLLWVQRLETAGEFYKSLSLDVYKLDIVRFLLGMLYHNFKFVWEPVQKLIEDYAKQLKKDDFWEILKHKLEQTAAAIDYEESGAENKSTPDAAQTWRCSFLNEVMCLQDVTPLTQQQLLNYRNLLWMRLAHFGQIAEVKNRELVTIFLQFVDNEYRRYLEKREHTWDLRVDSKESNDVDAESDVEEDEEHKGPKVRRPARPKHSKHSAIAKAILQTLQSKLSMFVEQPNPKALYRERDLYAFYMELLAGPNPQLQKIALDCVMAYKVKALTAYKEHLYAFIDERKFKDELVNFKLDTVSPECRSEFVQMLLRVLYGKMITKGSQRGVNPQVRKSLILRFLGQCSPDEILWFLQMAFGRYDAYTNAETPIETIPALVERDFRLESVWSPKKLQNVVNLLELIRKEFGGLMDLHFQLYMLKLLTFVGSVCNAVLRTEATLMHPKMPIVFKNIRNAALLSLVNFFAHIDTFQWQAEHIKCLSEIFVWPSVERLSQESIHTPTVLLKLLLQWGEKPQHFQYLNQTRPDAAPDRTIFSYIMDLLVNEKAKVAVRGPILTLIERILVMVNGVGEAEQDAAGLSLLRPYISQILMRLKMNFSMRSAKQSIDKRDLNILSLLTCHVKEAKLCDSLLQLLLPILIARSQSNANEEIVCQVITTLANLIKCLDVPELYLLKIAPLFEQVHEVVARKMLCDILLHIAKKRQQQSKSRPDLAPTELCEHLRTIARLMLQLNAWDQRWVEQPDYDKRLDALKTVRVMLERDQVDMDLGVLVIYNCFYFLKFDKDLGLRDNAGEHLRLLVPKLIAKYAHDREASKMLLDDVVLNILRRLLRNSHENVRHEAIKLLGEIAKHNSEAHPILSDLAPLADLQDEEVDFFENLTHLQAHRHGRALLKYCQHAATLTRPPNVRTLTQFVLPLATHYLLKEQFASKHAVVDAAIEALGVSCQLLPWQHYYSMLRYYLMKMRLSHEHQKQAVRIVVRILDAFHFDLSHTEAGVETVKLLKTRLTEEQTEATAAAAEIEHASEAQQGDETSGQLPCDLEGDEEEDAEQLKSDSAVEESTEPVLHKSLVLSGSASKRVMVAITMTLLPTLNRAITEKSSYDMKHKVNRKRFSAEREEEEIQRVPIALAMVKLMQKLPKQLLDNGLPGVFMKVCTFLRSPLKSVRMLARDVLKKIMLTVGSQYLALLVDHLQTLLTRGFQVHVLAVTVHGVLDALSDHLQPADIESCMNNLLEVMLNDIFGDITAEKEIDKIAAHTPEAKPSAKSFLVLQIIAHNIREHCLLDLLMPFREHLMRSHQRKITQKIQECFGKIVNGLVENAHISRESLLIFTYGTISESITDLLPGSVKHALSEQEKEKMRRARPDCYLIQPAPRSRYGAVNKSIKTNAQANAHILIEFGLQMLHYVLKRKKLTEIEYEPFLNPLLPLLRDALKSTHARITTFALKCLAAIWNESYELPALQEHLIDIVNRIFEILKNFSTFGSTKQEDNYQLVKSTFKTIVALLRKCSSYDLNLEQIDHLVLFIDQDLYEGEHQSLSFSLLKALLARHIDTRGLHNVMTRLRELSITAASDFVRDETRTMLVTYIMDYPLKKRVEQLLKFFTAQLCYALPAGRLSAIRFLVSVIKKFPLKVLAQHAEFLYLSLGTRLTNDDDSACRKAVAEAIELLISRLEKSERARLFDVTLLFFNALNKPSVREMGAQLCSRFLNVEKQSFGGRLKLVLPLLVARISTIDPHQPGRFVRAPIAVTARSSKREKHSLDGLIDAEELREGQERARDHELIQMQFCMQKIFEHCSAELWQNDELTRYIDELAYESQKLLGHEHSWVRCNAAGLIAHILSGYDFDLVGHRLSKATQSEVEVQLNFIYADPAYDIKCLVLDLCAQVCPGETPQPMMDEIVKIFLYIANMLRAVPLSTKKEPDSEAEAEAEAETDTKMGNVRAAAAINLNWLLRQMRYLINKEVAKAPHCITVRTALFTLFEGLITMLSVETVERLAPALLMPLVREMSEEQQNVEQELRQLALRVGARLRKRIGNDAYDKLRSGAQTALMIRRATRKRMLAQEKVHDPIRAAKRKAAIQERKKVAKKRKSDLMRGKVADTKQKLRKRKRKAEDDFF